MAVSRHRLGSGDRVTHRRGHTALVEQIDVGEFAGGGRHHVFHLGNRAAQPGPVHLDHEHLAFDVERKTASVADLTEPAGVNTGGDVLDSKPLTVCVTVSKKGHGAYHTVAYVNWRGRLGQIEHHGLNTLAIRSGFIRTTESYPLPRRPNIPVLLILPGVAALASALVGCSSNPVDAPPPTITPASAAVSPPVTTAPAGEVRPLDAEGQAALVDAATQSLVVISPLGPDASTVTVFADAAPGLPVRLDGVATAMAGDGHGTVFLATRGGYFRLELASGTAERIGIEGHTEVDFTAVARRADGRLVLGSADGTVYTLDSDRTVGTQVKIFARVDSIVTQGDTAVVLDRGQTSVTSLNADGTEAAHALRAGEGATTMTADPAGRVLVADTRGEELLVYGVDPLMLRQRYPVPDAPYALAASGGDTPALAWVTQTATNTVVGYDLATGTPVEKVRYRTVEQPNSLAFDNASNTLYVVSGAGAGVQVIAKAVP